MDGQTIKVRAWDTIYYPLEMAIEILEGPFGGLNSSITIY